MQLKTILNRVQRHGSFVYEAVRFVETAAEPDTSGTDYGFNTVK